MAELRNATPLTREDGLPALAMTYEEAEKLAYRLEQAVVQAKSEFTDESFTQDGVMLALAGWPISFNINC